MSFKVCIFIKTRVSTSRSWSAEPLKYRSLLCHLGTSLWVYSLQTHRFPFYFAECQTWPSAQYFREQHNAALLSKWATPFSRPSTFTSSLSVSVPHCFRSWTKCLKKHRFDEPSVFSKPDSAAVLTSLLYTVFYFVKRGCSKGLGGWWKLSGCRWWGGKVPNKRRAALSTRQQCSALQLVPAESEKSSCNPPPHPPIPPSPQKAPH